MLYLLCVICPPLAVLLAGRPASAILCFLLTCLGGIPGMIHAFFVVSDARAERRAELVSRRLGREP